MRLKKLLPLMVMAIILTMSLCVQAEVFDKDLIPLSDQKLAQYLESAGYQSEHLFQPSSREEKLSGSTLPYTCPILAKNDDGSFTLLIVKKQGDDWIVTSANENALSRNGFILCGFSIEEFDEYIEAYFSFYDSNDTESELGLQISDVYPSQFTFFHSEGFQVVFNYDRGITVTVDAPFQGRFSYEIQTDELNCDASYFSLSTCPLSVNDIISFGKSISHNDNIALFAIPDDSLEPIVYIKENDDIVMLNYQVTSDWAMVAYNHNIFFVHSFDVTSTN